MLEKRDHRWGKWKVIIEQERNRKGYEERKGKNLKLRELKNEVNMKEVRGVARKRKSEKERETDIQKNRQRGRKKERDISGGKERVREGKRGEENEGKKRKGSGERSRGQ